MPKIVLDPATFKVLASDTRLDILRMLDERPRTVSELGRDMRLNKATVFEHLQVLVTAELIQKIEREGSKWVYYKLNWKGQNLLHPENTTIFVLLGIAGAGVGGAILQLGRMLEWWLAGEGASDRAGEGDAAGGDERTIADKPADEDAQADSDSADGSAQDDSAGAPDAEEQQAVFAERGDDERAEGAGRDESGWLDWVDDARTWTLGLLALIAVAAAVVSLALWRRAKRLELVERAALAHRVGGRAVPADVGDAPAASG